jgi:hypothetical protein
MKTKISQDDQLTRYLHTSSCGSSKTNKKREELAGTLFIVLDEYFTKLKMIRKKDEK